MKSGSFLLAFVLIVFISFAHAQRDDRAFLGVSLGLPVSQQTMPPCSKFEDGGLLRLLLDYDKISSARLCWQPTHQGDPVFRGGKVELEKLRLTGLDLMEVVGEKRFVVTAEGAGGGTFGSSAMLLPASGSSEINDGNLDSAIVSDVLCFRPYSMTSEVLSALIEKRGKPDFLERGKVQNLLGVSREQIRARWDTTWGAIEFSSPSPTMFDLTIEAYTKEWAQEKQRKDDGARRLRTQY